MPPSAERHAIVLAPVIGSFVLLATLQAAAQENRAGGPQSGVTAGVDYSRVPVLDIDARGISTDELLPSLAKELGFEVKRIGNADLSILIRGRFIGELEDLLPSLLRHETYAVVLGGHRSDGRRTIRQVLLFDTHAGDRTVAPVTVTAQQLRDTLAAQPNVNRDMRSWMEGWLGQLPATDPAAEMIVNLSDAPTSVTEMLERTTEPLAPDFSRTRMENRASGTPPRYLTGANDAAQNDVASALARTTNMALHNLKALTDALRQACLAADCPGITQAEIDARERQSREGATAPEPTR